MKEKSYSSLHEYFTKYSQSDILPLHMPGHKRRSDILPDWNVWDMDFTEVSGLDNLYEAEEILKEGMDRLAKSFGAIKSFYLVNGSTGGILTAIAACVNKGTILVARNCHKSVYNAAYLNNLRCDYLYPEIIDEWGIYGGISPDAVREALEHNSNIKAVVITSPTYEGIVSDISTIAKIVHEYNIPLIIDEAHGAHFNFIEDCPPSATACGADIVIQSFHKLLPALTQTAVMHVMSDRYVDITRLQRYYSMYQTSSPSYLFMASIDYALEFMEGYRNSIELKEYIECLNKTKENFLTFKNIKILQNNIINSNAVYGLDPTKLLIACREGSLSGAELEEIFLKDYRIQAEMSKGNNVLLMTSVVERAETFGRLREVLADIDKRCEGYKVMGDMTSCQGMAKLEHAHHASVVMTSYEALNAANRSVKLEEAEGAVSAEYVYVYPPGVPILVPGELITDDIIKVIAHYREEYVGRSHTTEDMKKAYHTPGRLQGLNDKTAQNILIVDNLSERSNYCG